MEECPLCGTKFDETDKNFKPCTCSYQVCSFCFDKLINDKEIEPLCPACRVPYNLKKIKFTPPSNTKVVSKVVKKKKKKETPKKKEEISLKSRKELENYRVLQRNLVYITNIPLSLAKEEILRKHEYFGQYGNITKIVVNKGKYFNTTAPGGPSVSAYVTFDKKRMEDTYLCILAVDGCWLENRTLRASYGTTKYCSFFLKNITCTNNNCMYLHALGRKEDSFSKEEMNQGKHLTECGLKIDFNLVPKPTKASILPPPGVIAKELPKDKRKRGYFDPNEKKELNVKLPQKTDSTSPQDKPLEELSEKLESSSLNDKEEDDDSSEGEEEDASEDDSDNQNQNSSEEKKEELSISEKIKNMKRQKNIKYGNDFNRYKKQPPGMQRRKPSGEVEDNPILSNPKPNRKHSDHHYDKPSERDTSYRRYSDIGHEKPKGSSKFEPTILRGKFSHVRPPSYPKPNRGSDGSIFSLPSINESEDLNPPNNIWSEEFSRSRSVSNVIPPFTEMEQGHYVNPGFYYPPPMQYNMHYGQEPHKEDERNYGKHPNHPGNNHPNFNPNGHPVNHPNFQNPYFKQKMSANDVYWGGYPNYPMYPPGQYHPNMPYHPGFNYPNYPPNYYPPMYHQEPPQPNNNGPNTQNPPNQNNNGNNNNNKGSNDKNGGNGNNGGGNGNNGQSHNGHLFPSHLSGNNKHSSSTPNIHNMNVPLYYTQRGSQENFSEHLLNRNYQQQFQPNPPMYHYPLFPPPGHTFSYLPNPPSNNGNGNGNGNQNSQSNPSFLGHNNHNVPSGYSTPHNSQHNTLSSILDTNEGSDNDVILKDPTYDSDSHRDNVTSHDVKDQNNSNVTQGNDDTNETSGDDEENINVDSNSSSTNTNKSHKKHK